MKLCRSDLQLGRKVIHVQVIETISPLLFHLKTDACRMLQDVTNLSLTVLIAACYADIFSVCFLHARLKVLLKFYGEFLLIKSFIILKNLVALVFFVCLFFCHLNPWLILDVGLLDSATNPLAFSSRVLFAKLLCVCAHVSVSMHVCVCPCCT